MTRPNTSSRLLLIAQPHPDADAVGATPIRRYRLARLALEHRPVDPQARWEHLERTFE